MSWELGRHTTSNFFLLCPHVPPQEPGEEGLIWQHGHLFFCLHTELKMNQCRWDSQHHADSHLLQCVVSYSELQEPSHTEMAPYITPPPTGTQVSIHWKSEWMSRNKATIMFEWFLPAAGKCSAILRNKDKCATISEQLQVQLSGVLYFLPFPDPLFSPFSFSSLYLKSTFLYWKQIDHGCTATNRYDQRIVFILGHISARKYS